MATDLKPSTAPLASALGGIELIPCTQGGASKALTPAQIKTYIDPVLGALGAVDNAVLRADGAAGRTAQASLLVVDDAGAASGLTKLTMAGPLALANGTAGAPGLIFNDGGGVNSGAYYDSGTNSLRFEINAEPRFVIETGSYVVRMSADGHLVWSGVADASNNSPDCGIKRFATGVVLVTNGSSSLGALAGGRPVEASTAGSGGPNILLVTESRKLLTNEGATAEAYNTLPTSAPVGTEFVACCVDTDGIRLTAPTGETIRLSASATATGGFVRSVAIGSSVAIVKINATQWLATSIVGTWTVDV